MLGLRLPTRESENDSWMGHGEFKDGAAGKSFRALIRSSIPRFCVVRWNAWDARLDDRIAGLQ
jgi:hypothetical protein